MRIKRTDNPWQSQPHHQGLVNIETHSLWASVCGPIRKTENDPLLIFITGAGGPSAEYIKLQQQLSSFIRVLFYDRAGYDRSTLPAGDKIYASDTTRDLTQLLAVTNLEPPYIVVAHSFGGIIARTFLEVHKDNPHVIVGMFLLDTATELMLQLFPRVPPHEWVAVVKHVDIDALTDIKRQSGMTEGEWDYAIAAQKRCAEAQKREDTHASARQLALRHQFDQRTLKLRPLLVLRCDMASDYQLLYEAGVKLGDGTEEERRVAREFMETFGLFHDQIARAQCRLSENFEYKYFAEWGHDLPIRRPTVVVEEIRKLLGRVSESAYFERCVRE
ncbi:Nn.00g071730.m01.CDS01 [Neocucurbitaria sp. VM-36]